MDSKFTAILQNLINDNKNGKEIFLDKAKCKALLADYARGKFKKESRFLWFTHSRALIIGNVRLHG
jgi:hypothetical protein